MPHLLPEGALRCVWMAAGLVAFKLCDRERDCESCPFDRAICPAPKNAVDRPPAQAADFPADRAYGPGHAWAIYRGRNCLRIGIDAAVAPLLRLRGVIVPPTGSRLRRGRAGCWLLDELGPLPLRMPADGALLRANPRLAGRPELAERAPYGDGWLLEMACDAAAGLRRLLPADRMRQRSAQQIQRLWRRRAPAAGDASPPVGCTLADGGEIAPSPLDRSDPRAAARTLLELLGG